MAVFCGSRWCRCCLDCCAMSCVVSTLERIDCAFPLSGKSRSKARYLTFCSVTMRTVSLPYSKSHVYCIWLLAVKPCVLCSQILSEWFGLTIIHSCAKLSYDHAQVSCQSIIRLKLVLFLISALIYWIVIFTFADCIAGLYWQSWKTVEDWWASAAV